MTIGYFGLAPEERYFGRKNKCHWGKSRIAATLYCCVVVENVAAMRLGCRTNNSILPIYRHDVAGLQINPKNGKSFNK